MNSVAQTRIESNAINDFARVMKMDAKPLASNLTEGSPVAGRETMRMDLNQNNVKNGLGQLVLTLVKLLHQLLERQAIRQIDAGSLSNEEIERIGLTLMKQAQEIDRLRLEFGLEEGDLNLDLGPLGKLL